jgi:hypothetical protein
MKGEFNMKLVRSLGLLITLVMMFSRMEQSVCFHPTHKRPVNPNQVNMFFWNKAQLAKIESEERIELMRIAHADLNQKASRELEVKKLEQDDKKLEHAALNQKASRELEVKKLEHADLNQKASRELEVKKLEHDDKKLEHADLNQKASRELEKLKIALGFVYLVILSSLIVFFGRGGGSNIDKILVVTKGFQTSLDKLVFIAQGFSFKALGEYLCLKVTWIRQMFGMVS